MNATGKNASTTTRPKDFDVRQVIKKLLHTSGCIVEYLPAGMLITDMNKEDRLKLYSDTFYCYACGLWLPISHLAFDANTIEDTYCNNCCT